MTKTASYNENRKKTARRGENIAIEKFHQKKGS